jgi:DNA-directed RNA polymerase subunit RPC12/RpoP
MAIRGKCKRCGAEYLAKNSQQGTTISCKSCGRKIEVASPPPSGETSSEKGSEAQDDIPVATEIVDIRCPNCGTEYECEGDVVGQAIQCETCSNEFIAIRPSEEPPPLPVGNPSATDAGLPPPLPAGIREHASEQADPSGRGRHEVLEVPVVDQTNAQGSGRGRPRRTFTSGDRRPRAKLRGDTSRQHERDTATSSSSPEARIRERSGSSSTNAAILIVLAIVGLLAACGIGWLVLRPKPDSARERAGKEMERIGVEQSWDGPGLSQYERAKLRAEGERLYDEMNDDRQK